MQKKKQVSVITPEQKIQFAEKLKDTSKLRTCIHDYTKSVIGTGSVYRKGERYLNKLASGEVVSEDDQKEFTTVINSTNPMLTHKFLLGLIQDEGERNCIMEFSEDIAKEYDCKTTMELSICETIASSYYAMMKGSQQVQQMYNIDYISNEKNGYYTMISKEVEKQSRLYMNAMMTLRALKSPFGNVSIRAKNAFIGENQQFNNNQSPTNESITSP